MSDGTDGTAGGDGTGGAAAAALAGAQGGAGAGDAGGGTGGAVDTGGREWLPEQFRADPVFTNMKTVENLAQAFADTKKMVGDRIPKPSADNMEAFYAAVRPADAAVYDIAPLEGDDPAFAEAFRPLAHKLALQPDQVSGLVAFQNEFVAAERAKMAEAEAARVTEDNKAFDAFKDKWNADNGGSYDAMLGKVADLTKAVGWDTELMTQINDKVGSAKMLEGLFSLAKGMGDLPLHGGGDAGGQGGGYAGLSPEAASAKLDQLQGDAGWREKVAAGDVAANRERQELISAAARKKAA